MIPKTVMSSLQLSIKIKCCLSSRTKRWNFTQKNFYYKARELAIHWQSLHINSVLNWTLIPAPYISCVACKMSKFLQHMVVISHEMRTVNFCHYTSVQLKQNMKCRLLSLSEIWAKKWSTCEVRTYTWLPSLRSWRVFNIF